jgi:hypothetical protein
VIKWTSTGPTPEGIVPPVSGKNLSHSGILQTLQKLGRGGVAMFVFCYPGIDVPAGARAHTRPCPACQVNTSLDYGVSTSLFWPTPSAHPSPSCSFATHPLSHRIPSAQLGNRQTQAHTLRASARPPRQRGLFSLRPPPRRGATGKKSSAQSTSEPTDHQPARTPAPFCLPWSGGLGSAPVPIALQPA